jgi:uncharacterized protein (TIRG00374 family)
LKKNILAVLKILFFLAIGVFFIWIFLRKLTSDQKREIWESFLMADYSWLALSVVLGILSHVIRALRWKILLEPMGHNPKNSNTFFAVMIGYLANMALPRLGEVTRCGVLNKYEKIPINQSIGTVIIERSIDLVLFILLFFINLIIFFDKLNQYVEERIFKPLGDKFAILDQNSFLLTGIFIIGLILLALFIFFRKKISHLAVYQKTKSLILGFWKGLFSITKIKKPVTFIIQSLAIWALYYLMIYVCFFSLPATSNLGFDACLSMLIFGSIGIMVVQGGIGIYPAIIAETLILYNLTSTTGYALGWLTWSAQTIMIVIAGIASLILLPILNRKENEQTRTG